MGAKPAYGATLNSSNALYTDLALCFPFNDGSGNPKDAVSGNTIPIFGTCTWGTDATYGGYLQGDGSTGYCDGNFSGINHVGPMPFSLALLFSDQANDTQYGRLAEKGANTEWVLSVNQAADSNKVTFAQAAQGSPPTTSTVVCDGTFHVVHATYNFGTTTQLIYSDGGNAVSVTGGTFDLASADLYLFRYGGGGLFSHAKLAGLWVWMNRVLTPTEITSHYGNLWQMFNSAAPTTATLSAGASSGYVGVASANFTITLDNAAQTGGVSCPITSSVGGDTITSTPVVIASGSSTGTFTITPSTVGSRNITLGTTTPSLTIAGSPQAYNSLTVGFPAMMLGL